LFFDVNPNVRALGDNARAADCFRGGSREEFHQWWKTRFEGESGIDQGGLFRQTISDINDELVSVLGSPFPRERL
jgi:hypothetical protein